MQHEFTDAQILYAADDATEETTSSYKAVGLPYLRAFLNSLPDPDNEWEPSNVTHVRKGDRVRWTVPGCEDNESYEIVVAAVTNQDGVVLHSETRTYYFPPGSVVDRIPEPVQHPDPAEHPVIIDGNGTSWFWSGTGDAYHSPERPGEYKDRFTNWTPGEVVPKVVETND